MHKEQRKRRVKAQAKEPAADFVQRALKEADQALAAASIKLPLAQSAARTLRMIADCLPVHLEALVDNWLRDGATAKALQKQAGEKVSRLPTEAAGDQQRLIVAEARRWLVERLDAMEAECCRVEGERRALVAQRERLAAMGEEGA